MQGEPVRVLHVIGNLGFGGVQSYLMSYLRAMDRERVVFDFVVQTPDVGALEAEAESLGSRVYHLPSSVSERAAFKQAFGQLLDAHPEYRIVEVHQNFRCLLPLAVAGRRVGVVRIAHSHNSYAASSPLHALYRPYFHARVGSVAQELWGCSQKANEWLYGRRNAASRAVVVPNAIDAARFAFSGANRAEVRGRYGIAGLCVGHVGTAADAKNHPFLLEAFARVLEERPDAHLLCVGCAPDARGGSFARQAEELGIAGHVTFTGLVPDPETYLSAMDVFAFPSLYEGLPIVTVEAQANGLRAVVSAEAVPREVNVCGAVDFVSLEEGAEGWARAVLAAADRGRLTDVGGVAQAGYDLATAAEALAARYEALAGE